MGKDKATLQWHDRPLYWQAIDKMLPFCDQLYISLPAHHPLFAQLSTSPLPPRVHLLPDDLSLGDIGPAISLLSAHSAQPTAAFLVFAVDFPLAPPAAFHQLTQRHSTATPPLLVHSYVHDDGNPEPLMSLWQPEALEALRRNAVERGRTGPCQTIRELLGLPSKKGGGRTQKGGEGVKEAFHEGERMVVEESVEESGGTQSASGELPSGLVRPLESCWLFNTNTPGQWQAALEMDRQRQQQTGP